MGWARTNILNIDQRIQRALNPVPQCILTLLVYLRFNFKLTYDNVGPEGLEPSAYSLKVSYSTIEL